MRLFWSVQEYAATVGIRALPLGQKNPFNRRNIGFLLIYSFFIVSGSAFIVFDANSFYEYAEAFYPWMTMIFTYIGLSINISMTSDMFRLIEQCEQTIDGGE